MLKKWNTHAEYQQLVTTSAAHLNQSQLKKLSFYRKSIEKLTSLDLDPLMNLLTPYYSSTGRPALNQPEIFRSYILMMDLGETSITNWINILKSDDILALLVGCSTDSIPSIGSYYGFIKKLWLSESEILSTKKLYPYNKNHKSGKRLGKNKKLPNKHPGIVKSMTDFYKDNRSFEHRFELLLQKIFALIGVAPSIDLGLVDTDSLTLAGDGTSVHIHASHYGNKVCDCRENGIYNCKCDRRFSAPDANIGWDSDLATWYHGYTLYCLSTYNKDVCTDLPVYLRFVQANRHDSVTGIVALAEFRELYPDIPIKNICFDSANDNYPTYELCKHWGINPFIDLNDKRGAKPKYPNTVTLSKNNIPTCIANHEMIYNGYCINRYRHKWRCPLACKKVDSCNCKEQCSPSDYGRVFYTKSDWDLRIFTPVPRGIKEYKYIYKIRTSSERVNNRILNDYNLHAMRIRGKQRFSFFTMIAGINIHLDARVKQANLNKAC